MIRRKFHVYFSLPICIILIISLPCTSCHKKDPTRHEIVVEHHFADGNWTFEDEVIDFPFEIADTAATYRIEFDIMYDSTVNVLSNLPVTITLVAPDGMNTFVTGSFDFITSVNNDIGSTGRENECSVNMVAFPRKQLNQRGEYHIKFYRKAQKYDNYGLNCLTMRVVPVDRDELKSVKH